MEDFYDFEVIFGSVDYDEETRKRIMHHRQALENVLFIDRLLKALGISKVTKSYPPRSNDELRNLHSAIISSSSPDHHKLSALYYLLKDLRQPPKGYSAEGFSKVTYLPNKYKTFVDGIWYLDRLKFEKALGYLTEPALTPTFPEEILYTLCRLSTQDITLPIAYYQTVSLDIKSSKVLEAYFLTLCQSSITEAFSFSRSQGDLNHHFLFEKLITSVHANFKGATRASRGVELIGLPFNEEEESWFEEFLEEGKGSTLPGSVDTLTMRRIATGRSSSTPNHRRRGSGQMINGINWDTLKANTYLLGLHKSVGRLIEPERIISTTEWFLNPNRYREVAFGYGFAFMSLRQYNTPH